MSFTLLSNSGLTALPIRNLLSNVGFREGDSYTTAVAEPTVTDQASGELILTSFLLRDRDG